MGEILNFYENDMSVVELLNELNNKKIILTLDNGKIKYSGPKDEITSAILQKIKDNKEELIKYLWSNEKHNLIPISLSGEKTPLVLVHGGNSANFLPDFFKGERPILNYLDLGSDGEKIKFEDIDSLARFYIKQLKGLLPNGPYIFCGFSFGGLLASKMAEILQHETGDSIPGIIMFDSQTPNATTPSKTQKFRSAKGNKLIFLVNAVRKRIKKNKLYHIYFIVRKPLPTKYRKKHILSVYIRLSKTFDVSKVNSDLLIFRSKDNNVKEYYLGWEGKMNNIDLVPLDGDHLKILYNKENHSLIANRINSFINQLN